jgi:hypothetical protein
MSLVVLKITMSDYLRWQIYILVGGNVSISRRIKFSLPTGCSSIANKEIFWCYIYIVDRDQLRFRQL